MNNKYLYLFITLLICLFSCKTKKEAPKTKKIETTVVNDEKPTTSSPKYKENELILKLKKDLQADQIAKKYVKYKLTTKKQLSKSMNIWLLEYDTSTINPLEMLTMLKEDPDVIEAEFNKKISPRR